MFLTGQELVEGAVGGPGARDQRQAKRTADAGRGKDGRGQRDAAEERSALRVLALPAGAELGEAPLRGLQPGAERVVEATAI